VTLTEPITALGLRFNVGGYTIAGTGSNTLTAPAFSVTNSADVDTISAQITGTNLTLRGAGTLVLTGANTYTGTTTIASGALQGTTSSYRPTSSTTAHSCSRRARAPPLRTI